MSKNLTSGSESDKSISLLSVGLSPNIWRVPIQDVLFCYIQIRDLTDIIANYIPWYDVSEGHNLTLESLAKNYRELELENQISFYPLYSHSLNW